MTVCMTGRDNLCGGLQEHCEDSGTQSGTTTGNISCKHAESVKQKECRQDLRLFHSFGVTVKAR